MGTLEDRYYLTTLNYAGKGIRFDNISDRIWVSLDDMATASNTRMFEWERLEATQQFLKELEAVELRPVTETVQGHVSAELLGVLVIDEVAIDYAAWCSKSFRVWISQSLRQLNNDESATVSLPSIPATVPQLDKAFNLKQYVSNLNLYNQSRLSKFLSDGMGETEAFLALVQEPISESLLSQPSPVDRQRLEIRQSRGCY